MYKITHKDESENDSRFVFQSGNDDLYLLLFSAQNDEDGEFVPNEFLHDRILELSVVKATRRKNERPTKELTDTIKSIFDQVLFSRPDKIIFVLVKLNSSVDRIIQQYINLDTHYEFVNINLVLGDKSFYFFLNHQKTNLFAVLPQLQAYFKNDYNIDFMLFLR